jgi:hypothetical protein
MPAYAGIRTPAFAGMTVLLEGVNHLDRFLRVFDEKNA